MNVSLFIPCFIDQLYPETGMNMVRILERLGCNVQYPKKQTCCGQPACNAGFQDEARAVAKKFCNDFSQNSDYIVGPSGSCVGYITHQYEHLLQHAGVYNYNSIKGRVFEFTDFVVNKLGVQKINARLQAKATYHDGCASLRECGIKQAPRTLLQNVEGLELVEMKECETCCGFGGTFSVKFEPISIGMAKNKVDSALAAGAELIISADASCLMHLDAYIESNNIPLRTMHICDVLTLGWS